MFATLLGGLPRPPLPQDATDDELAAAAVDLQVAEGLEPVTDGRVRWPDRFADAVAGLDGVERDAETGGLLVVRPPSRTSSLTVDSWRFAASRTVRAVKQALPGPYTLGRRLRLTEGLARADVTLALARALRAEVADLRDAGCPLVEVEERDASAIGADPDERALFTAAHDALTEDVSGIHLSLSLMGPSADAAGPGILHPAYASYAFDLIEGPDAWRLVVDVPGERGVVCGAFAVRDGMPRGPEVLLYAAGYAASTGGRGMVRVGLAPSGGLERLDWDVAERLVHELGAGVRVAAMEPGPEKAERLDPRAIDMRSAALGRYAPQRKRR